jgi:hypothetical protein
VNWLRLFPDSDYRFQMGLRPGDAPAFFGGAQNEDILALRRRLVEEARSEYLLEADDPSVRETLDLLSHWTGRRPLDLAAAAGGCEADFVILTPDAAHRLCVTAGVVCFPSSWSLREKAGQPMSAVHGPVPGLNADMGQRIDTFLSRLAPGAVWERENWGLSADEALDHHPRHTAPSLTQSATLETSWLRLERQIFLRLSGGGVLFGIHVSVHRLDALAGEPGVAPKLAQALETMTPAVADYKGLTVARAPLTNLLRGQD